MTDWLVQGCDYNPGWFPLYPSRVPSGGVKAYYWNERCLVAPKPKIDRDGYYYWPNWITRKVVPGLMSAPTAFIGLPNGENLSDALKCLIRYSSEVTNKLLEQVNGLDTTGRTTDPNPRWGIHRGSLRGAIHGLFPSEHSIHTLAGRPT